MYTTTYSSQQILYELEFRLHLGVTKSFFRIHR